MTEDEKMLLRQQVQSNQHEICVASMDEFVMRVDKLVETQGDVSIKERWKQLKGTAQLFANWLSTGGDLVTLTKLLSDLGGVGEFYIKQYGGKSHIILKGYPRFRNILTASKYGVVNPKVIKLGLGARGAMHAAKTGGIVTVLLITAYRITDYLLTDDATLSRLIGTLSTDIVKVGIATSAAMAAASFVAGITTIAVGPIVVVIVVGAVVSWGLGEIDDRFGITDRLIAELDSIANDFNHMMYEINRQWNYYENHPDAIICLFGPC